MKGRRVEVEKMRKDYKLQNTNYKQITNYKLQITKGVAPPTYYCKEGSHGLHQGFFKLQTMTALIKSF
jgi:hypothetical protein